MLTYDSQAHPLHREPHGDLLRQAYLLTGDPEQAPRLAERAAGAGEFHARRHGPEEALEYAKAELVRSYVADPGPSQRPSAGSGSSPHPDVAVWQAVCRLSPRRRAAIVLRYDEGLTEEEAAARLGTLPQTVRADVDAAMLTLRTALPGVADPWARVAGALSAAGRGWSDYTRPAAARVAEVLAAPAPTPSPRPAHLVDPPARSARPVALAAVLATVVLLAAAVLVPRLAGGDAAPVKPGPQAGGVAPVQVPRLVVPSVDVPEGLLNWPPRGRLASDTALVDAATKAWKAKVPAAEAPASAISVLWAGTLDGRTAAVLQGLDRGGHPHLAQVDGASAGSVRLRHAEPLHPGTQVLSLLPPAGPSGVVRVLVSPETQIADGLLSSNPMDGKPLRPTPVGDDGVSDVLPSPPGVPTCSRVVLLGLDPAGQTASGARVLYSGIVAADMLGGMPMDVEVGSPTLAPAPDAVPDTPWFADGKKLEPKVPGKGTLTVAALGPRLPAGPLSDQDKRIVSARAYELRRGSGRWIGSIVEIGGKTACASVLPAPRVAAWALRCPLPGDMMPGVVQVVGAANVRSVDVALEATKSPAGQERYTGTAVRPADQPIEQAFSVLLVTHMFPCGTGTLRVHGAGEVSTLKLPVYTP